LWYLQCSSFCSVLLWLFAIICVYKWTVGLIFQSLWWMSLEFWWELHWTCRLILVVCWFCQSMSMGDLSIFCSLLWFLSSVVCCFPCRGHSRILSLFLSIWFFWGYCKWNCFPTFFFNVHCWCIENLWIFINWFCILLLCWSCL
jgi:hypothetical protein